MTINLMVANDTIMVKGAKNSLSISGSFRRGRDFEAINLGDNKDDKFKTVVLFQGTGETLQTCSHTDGETVEKVYFLEDKLIFVSEVDECFLRYSSTSMYVDAVYSIEKKEFYIPDDAEQSALESIIESL